MRSVSFLSPVNVVDFCGQIIRGDGMIVNSHLESKKYYFVTMGTDCHLTMQASSPKDKVQFQFRFFLVYSLLRVAPLSPAPVFPESPWGSAPLNPRLDSTSGEGSSDPCHAGSYVQFYDGRDRSSPPLGPPLCGKSPPRPVLSTGNYLTLRLVTRGTQPRVDFVGDFTSFRLGKTEISVSLNVLVSVLSPLDCCICQALTNQSAAVSLTLTAGMGSVSLSVWCAMTEASTTVVMGATWRKT